MSLFAIIAIIYAALGIGLVGGIMLAFWCLEKEGKLSEGTFSNNMHDSFCNFRDLVRSIWQTMLWPFYVILLIIYYLGPQ